MQNSHMRKCLMYIILVAAFLALLPFSICKAANTNTETTAARKAYYYASSGISYTFDEGTTVEMLQKILDSRQKPLKVVVFKADGSQRYAGCIENGDTVETVDENGKVQSRVTAVIGHDDSSSGNSSKSFSESGISLTSGNDLVLTGNTNVQELTEEITSYQEYENYTIEIKAYKGLQKQSGLICTGDTIDFLSDGKKVCSKTAVVLGDLTHCGSITQKGCDMLYDYLVSDETLSGPVLCAADMNGDGTVNTSDLLLMKKQQS